MKLFEMKPILVNNSDLMEELKASLYIEYNKEREGVHISDLIYCPRESVFRKLNPKEISDKELNFFTSGRAIHDAIQTLAKYYPDKYEVEKEIVFVPSLNGHTRDIDGVKDLKILAHIDLYDRKNNVVIEAKSARKAKLAIKDKKTGLMGEEQPKSFNVTQLKIYMSLMGSDKGYLIYQLLLNYDDYPFEIFEVSMTEDDRKSMLKWLTKEAINYVNALKNKDPSLARHVAFEPELNWKCNNCKFLNECIGMRNMEYVADKYEY